MEKYHKIQSVFKRNPENMKTFLMGQYTCPEFEYLANNEWMFTEKVDGTNVRVHWDGTTARFGGRTDNAQMPITLMEKLTELFPVEILASAFEESPIMLYGEGYGVKIQKGGGAYIPDGVGFILFDIRCGPWWLKRQDVEEIANDLSLPVVPVVGKGTLKDGIKLCQDGFKSLLRTTEPEGIVLKTEVELSARNGMRLITKLKLRDFSSQEQNR